MEHGLLGWVLSIVATRMGIIFLLELIQQRIEQRVEFVDPTTFSGREGRGGRWRTEESGGDIGQK